jgi:hypothetical protein
MQQKYLLLAIGLLVSLISSSQTNWYVSKTGNDSSPGTINSLNTYEGVTLSI